MIKSIKTRKYDLLLNGKKINIEVTRVKGFKEFIDNLIRGAEMRIENGFFIYNEKNIATFGMSDKLDIVWVDWDGKVIKAYENFDVNKISKEYKDTKFIYIFAPETIVRKKIIKNDIITHEYKRDKNNNSLFTNIIRI